MREMAEVMPIAVIGMAFRGPGDASNVERLWTMISETREAWSLVPKQKWNNEAFYHSDANRNGTVTHLQLYAVTLAETPIQSNVKGGHFFTDDLTKFDAPFFNMTRAEAEVRPRLHVKIYME